MVMRSDFFRIAVFYTAKLTNIISLISNFAGLAQTMQGETDMKNGIPTKKAHGIRWFRSIMMATAGILGLQGGAISGAVAATQATYYVSPSGSDLNPGTLDAAVPNCHEGDQYRANRQ